MGLVHFEDGKVLFYPYTPSKAAGIIFLFLFAGISLYHIFLIRKFKTKYFIPMVLGGICDTFGHLGRAWAGSAPLSPKPFMLQLMLILVAPVFISATIYITLGRLKESLLGHPRRKCSPTSIFILTDIIMEIGGHVVLGGLLFQLFVLVVYFALVVRFQRATQREVIYVEHWRRYLWTLVISVVAVWVRNLVRAAEFGQGWYGFVNQHEAMMYIFDSFLMFSVMVAFAVFHPGQLNDSQGSMAKGRQRVTSEQVVMGPFGNIA
ncbi:Protoporphyrin uptake protein 1 [Colletotrichum gloeosporioides]|uniref:Protoporphyrin uptake protein 1 n=1 Tax=Colletotrichum gloeosporioides TaxID=474922 RepID=A0A8H4FGH7_COLGL|nr:Protoporphyrin uptake protein 1 [Colletotrichum gloeosporioides]KAF3800916.1 Protoporphyrin uptake protein 1 [Colletotrichum gloeosporioides]